MPEYLLTYSHLYFSQKKTTQIQQSWTSCSLWTSLEALAKKILITLKTSWECSLSIFQCFLQKRELQSFHSRLTSDSSSISTNTRIKNA